jgi:TPR repeat protein
VSALNPTLAVPACEAAVKAAPGDARMIFQLGRAYAAAKAYDKARELYEQADALGHGLATNNLGALYADGWGVARDLAKARSYYLKAAQAGVPLAMYNFGSMAERGQGARRTMLRLGTGTKKRPRPDSRGALMAWVCSISTGAACRRI